MSDASMHVLLSTAAVLALVHTLIGVDHSLPFVALGRARGWSLRRTLWVTGLCGIGHVVSSVLLAAVGVGAGLALEQLQWIQGVRGTLAAWGLIAFGLVYAAWGAVRAARGHVHDHAHGDDATVWALFVVFAFGPCEALIPLVMAPAWGHQWAWAAAVIAVFGAITIATMLVVVAVGARGLALVGGARLDRHGHAVAGLAIAASGLAIQVLGI